MSNKASLEKALNAAFANRDESDAARRELLRQLARDPNNAEVQAQLDKSETDTQAFHVITSDYRPQDTTSRIQYTRPKVAEEGDGRVTVRGPPDASTKYVPYGSEALIVTLLLVVSAFTAIAPFT